MVVSSIGSWQGFFLIFLFLPWIFTQNLAVAAEPVENGQHSKIGASLQGVDRNQGKPTYSVNVDLVTTDVRVVGRNSQELRKEDFIIYDKKVLQEVTHFSYDQRPIAVALLIDKSSSVSQNFPALQIASLLALNSLKPEDQVALFSFSSRCEWLVGLTYDRLLIAKAISTLQAEGGTNISSALEDVITYLHNNAPDRRRAVILVSDNCQSEASTDSDFGQRLWDVESRILETGVTLYNVRFPEGGSFLNCPDSNAAIKRLTDSSGGDQFEINSSYSIQTALKDAISGLRHQYTLGFNPSDLGEVGSYHELDVRLRNKEKCRGCKLQTRKGYYVEVHPASSQPSPIPSVSDADIEMADELIIQRSILTAATTPLELPDVHFTVEARKQSLKDDEQQMDIHLNIDPSEIKFKDIEGSRRCNLQIAIFYDTNSGQTVSYDWKRYVNNFNIDEFKQVMKEGIQYRTSIPVELKQPYFKVVVFDEFGDKIGSKLVNYPQDK